jgi:hypothetical protein
MQNLVYVQRPYTPILSGEELVGAPLRRSKLPQPTEVMQTAIIVGNFDLEWAPSCGILKVCEQPRRPRPWSSA